MVEVFNHHFKRLEEMGTMERTRQSYFGNVREAAAAASICPVVEASALGFDNLFMPAGLVVSGVMIAVFLLALEILVRKVLCKPARLAADYFEEAVKKGFY